MTSGVEIMKLNQDKRTWYTVSYYDKDIKAFKEFDDLDDAMDFVAFLLVTCSPLTLKNVREKFRS